MSELTMTDAELSAMGDMSDTEPFGEVNDAPDTAFAELDESDRQDAAERVGGESYEAEGVEAGDTYEGADPDAAYLSSDKTAEAATLTAAPEIDYAQLVHEDLMTLGGEFPEMRGADSITELRNPLRYAALRDLGLSPREAYLATGGRKIAHDTRGHLSSAVPRGAGAPRGTMSRSELERARELFPGLGDRELMGLYRKVSV